MNVETLEMYEIFKRSLTEPEARKVITYMEDAKHKEITKAVEHKFEHLATKEDLAKSNADNIKWMFVFWIGQIGATIGFVLFMLKR